MSEYQIAEDADIQRRMLLQGAGFAILSGASSTLAAAQNTRDKLLLPARATAVRLARVR